MKLKLIIFVLLLSQQYLFAADDDTRLRLNQEIQQQQIQSERQLLKGQDVGVETELPHLVIQGQEYQIEENNPQQLAQALYLAVMQKQWQNVVIYLQHYKKVENYDQALTEFAEGTLDRTQGKLEQARQKFKHSLEIQPNNIIVELELARILFEQQKNKDSKALFQKISSQLARNEDKKTAIGLQNTVDLFLIAIQKRDAWQGSIAFGGRYATNINNASERFILVPQYGMDKDGNIVITSYLQEGTPDPIDANGLDYEATLNKRWSLSGNHGIAFRGLGYGQVYPNESDYNELTFNFNAGYSYQDQRNQILIAPVFEHKYYVREALYNAWGGRAEWMRFIGQDKALKLETEIKDFNYSNYTTQNGMEYSAFATFWKIFPKQWTLFGGLDYVDHNTEEKYFAAFEQEGLRIGVSKQFNAGFNATLSNSYRWRQYDKYVTGFGFNTRRHDFEQNYNLIVSAPRWQFYGLTPTLNYRYNRNKSNVDWLYSYDKHNISLKLEHRF